MKGLVQRFQILDRHDHGGRLSMTGNLDDFMGGIGLFDQGGQLILGLTQRYCPNQHRIA